MIFKNYIVRDMAKNKSAGGGCAKEIVLKLQSPSSNFLAGRGYVYKTFKVAGCKA